MPGSQTSESEMDVSVPDPPVVGVPVPSNGVGAQAIRACLKGLSYDGDKNIEKIDQYLKVLAIRLEQSEAEEVKFFRFIDHTLTGEALTWFLGLDKKPASLSEFRKTLLGRFVAPGLVDELELHWDETVQKANQGIDDYLSAINLKISVTGSTVSDDAKLRCLLKGVRCEYLVDMGPADRASLGAFIEHCRKKEYSLAYIKGRKSIAAERAGPVMKTHAMVCDESGATGAMPDLPQEYGRGGWKPRPIRCWNCREEGHPARLCPFRKPGVRGYYHPNRSDPSGDREFSPHEKCSAIRSCEQERCFMHCSGSSGAQSRGQEKNLN
jgi:hypothetical protein